MSVFGKPGLDMNAGGAESVSTQSLDHFSEFLSIPVSKLDADQYSAEDVDGVTESVFGSGNLNFMMLQAGQTNELLAMNASPFQQTSSTSAHSGAGVLLKPAAAAAPMMGDQSGDTFKADGNMFSGSAPITPLYSGGHSSSGFSAQNFGGGGDGEGRSGSNGLPGFGFNGQNGEGRSGGDGLDGADGGPGPGTTIINEGDNYYNTEGDGDVLTNTINTTVSTVITNITNILNQLPILDIPGTDPADTDLDLGLGGDTLPLILDPVEDLIGDVDAGLGIELLGNGETSNAAGDSDVSLNGVLNNNNGPLGGLDLDVPLDPVEAILGDIDLDLGIATNLLNSVAPGMFDDAAGGTGIDTAFSVLHDNLAGPVEDILGQSSNDDGNDSDLDVGLALGGEDQLGVNEIVHDLGLGDIAQDLGLDDLPLGDVVENLGLGEVIEQLGLGDPLADLGVRLDNIDLGNLGDLGLPEQAIDGAVDLVLDPVENLTGDIDIDTDIVLLGAGTTDNAAGDSDLTLGSDFDLAGTDIGLSDIGLDVPLDSIEAITGDIDINLGVASDLLGQVADPLFNDGAGGTGDNAILAQLGDQLANIGELVAPVVPELPEFPSDTVNDILASIDQGLAPITEMLVHDLGVNTENGGNAIQDAIGWTENTIPDAGSIIGSIVNQVSNDVLPDPVGQISEGLGNLLDHGGLLGGHGNHHHGGLFG